MKDYLKVAIVQPTLDNNVAWSKYSPNAPKMDYAEAMRVWKQIIHTLDGFINLEDYRKPQIIIFPELTIAERFESEIRQLADQTGCIIITGLDFIVNDNVVENKALVAIPYNWPHKNGRSRAKTFYFGKRTLAREEKNYLESCGNITFSPCNSFYLLNAGEFGRIGLAICADFYDIERFALYKGRIQHLFIIAYNKDIKSFYYLCEAISRLVYCNVIICNTGHYGGSICFSLRDKDHKRYIYRHEGAELFASQIVSLPIKSFKDAQKTDGKALESGYKNPPPGYKWLYDDND